MRVLGTLSGAAIMLVGASMNEWGWPLIIIGMVELGLASLTFLFVREGPAATPRHGRAWSSIAREAWGTDVLRERSFVRMTGVRLLFLMGIGIFVNISLLYIERSLGQTDRDWRSVWSFAGLAMLILGTVLATFPAAWISNRVGRKRVIWAATAIAAVGILVIAVAPDPLVAMPGILLMGIGSGAYLAVDWALMTEVIPLAASGRYMGLANIANSISGPLGLVLGGILMDACTRAGNIALGPRVAVATGVLALAGAAWLLRDVQPRRDPRPAHGLAAA
jgi:MFS family permease